MTESRSSFVEPQRELATRQIAAGEARSAVFRRTYDVPIEDVWEACTDPGRLQRWFLPVEGELQVGGSVDLGGVLHCEILRCDPPHLLTYSQVYEDLPPEEIELRLSPDGEGGTMLELEHATVSREIEWNGRLVDALSLMGEGWEPGLVALGLFLHDELPLGYTFDSFGSRPELASFMANARETWATLLDAAARGGETTDD